MISHASGDDLARNALSVKR